MENNEIRQIQTYVDDNNLNAVEKSDEEGFEKVKNDVIEFMECAKRCILPHNQLMYNIVINALEMMIVRMEHEDNITNIMTSKNINFDDCNCDQNQQEQKIYDTSKLSEEVKSEIDNIINELLSDDEEENKNK